MQKLYAFVNFKYVANIETEDNLLTALAKLQKRLATKDWQTFAILESTPGREWVLCQEFKVDDDSCVPRKVSWNRAYKIVPGVEQDGLPDYEYLINLIPDFGCD